MSSAAVFERRNKQIQDALDSGNLKQALQLCEKRIKKGETSPFLLAWKANILCAHNDAANKQRGIKESLEICRAEPPIANLETIELLCDNLTLSGEHQAVIYSLWERAAKAKPHVQELQTRWFSYAMEAKDWKAAQKAAMSLQHNFQSNRSYFFWAVFMCYLITIDTRSTEADRKLFGTLAYRMIAKAASLVPSDPKNIASQPRAIQDPEELLLLVRIFETQGRFVEIAETLNSKTLGTESRVAQGDWTFTQERLRSLRKAKLWEELLRTAKELLALPDAEAQEGPSFDPEERDDWEVWQGLLRSTREQSTQTFKDSCSFVSSYISRRPKSRNAKLCLLNLAEMGVQNGELPASDLVQHCRRYLDENGHKLYCFSDLRETLSSMTLEGRGEVLQYAASMSVEDTKSEGILAINCLKLKYCFELSSQGPSPPAIDDFVGTCLRLYRSLERPTKSDGVIESQPRDDLCIMAAMALLKPHLGASPQPELHPTPALIQAAAILHHLLVGSPHNYEALLLLTRLYLLLGAGSLALHTFARLNVKQMQYESVAHNLLTRLATIHPQPAPPAEGLEPKDYDPQLMLRLALDFYRRSERATAVAAVKGLECGSYVNTQGSLQLQDRLRRSLCQRVWALEERRVQRLLGGSPNKRYNHIAFNKSDLTDQRSFEGFMNLEAVGQPAFEEYVRIGPLIGSKGVKALSQVDTLYYLLAGPKVSSDDKISERPDASSFEGFASEMPTEELTSVEVENGKIHNVLLKGVAGLSNGAAGAPDVQNAVAAASAWVREHITLFTDGGFLRAHGTVLSDATIAPSWRYLHRSISCVETLSAMHAFAQRAVRSKSAKVPAGQLEELTSGIAQLLEAVRSNTKAFKAQITKPGVLGEIMACCTAGSEALQGHISDLIDEVALEAFAGGLIESWEEGLDGVNSVAVL